MTSHYSYEIWVPRARLYEAAVVIAERERMCEFGSLVWPDGRPLSNRSDAEKSERLRFGAEYQLTFGFAPDDELREYDEGEWGYGCYPKEQVSPGYPAQKPFGLSEFFGLLLGREPMREVACEPAREVEISAWLQEILQDEKSYSYIGKRDGDSIYVGPIETYFNEFCEGREWIDGEEDLARIRFVGTNSAISNMMSWSDSVRRFFVELAREVEAYGCVFEQEGPGQLLYFGGEELDIGFVYDAIVSPFDLANMAARPQSENARRMSALARYSWKTDMNSESGRELLEAARDENSGIRAQALKTLVEIDDAIAREAVKAALADPDARVRELAAYFYAFTDHRDFAPLVKLISSDASADVRLQAIRALGEFDNSLEVLREILLQTPAPENQATLETALDALDSLLYLPRSAEILREMSSRPDFPARARAQTQLAEHRAIQVRLAENARRR